ncbi:MAG TPA: hypothetical protein DEP99_02190 [Nitrospiraceae bacterium]|nr:hypothetical protein [Nitrospiraceae bacterium]
MSKKIEALESKRESLYNELSKIGDFRRGIISVNYRKCGKKNCSCSKEGHPGHGPQYLWNTTIKGKSYAKNLKLGHELQKCNEEITNYRHFLKICDELVEVNEKICDLRPVFEVRDDTELEMLKKNYESCFGRNTKRSGTHNKFSL